MLDKIDLTFKPTVAQSLLPFSSSSKDTSDHIPKILSKRTIHDLEVLIKQNPALVHSFIVDKLQQHNTIIPLKMINILIDENALFFISTIKYSMEYIQKTFLIGNELNEELHYLPIIDLLSSSDDFKVIQLSLEILYLNCCIQHSFIDILNPLIKSDCIMRILPLLYTSDLSAFLHSFIIIEKLLPSRKSEICSVPINILQQLLEKWIDGDYSKLEEDVALMLLEKNHADITINSTFWEVFKSVFTINGFQNLDNLFWATLFYFHKDRPDLEEPQQMIARESLDIKLMHSFIREPTPIKNCFIKYLLEESNGDNCRKKNLTYELIKNYESNMSEICPIIEMIAINIRSLDRDLLLESEELIEYIKDSVSSDNDEFIEALRYLDILEFE